MKLCGFDVGLNHQLFVIAGSIAARSRDPSGDATAEMLMRGPHR
jgi:hypothetical protein